MWRIIGWAGLIHLFLGITTTTSAETPNGARLMEPPMAEFVAPPSEAPPNAGPARVHVLVDAQARKVRRQIVRIADLFPGQSLDFQWSPAASNTAPVAAGSNLAQGEGVLIWKIQGLPAYDTRNLFARYDGSLRDGYPVGHGRIRYRSGAIYEGDWVAGRPHGTGQERTPGGEHYFGGFVNGLREGPGRLVLPDRTILSGTFVRGLAQGMFEVNLPGGTRYSSLWEEGLETGRDLDAVFMDSTLAGLLKAQSGDAASRSTLAVVLDAQTTAQMEVRYTAAAGSDRTIVYTANPDLVNAWNGSEPMQSGPEAWMIFDKPWDEIFAYLNAVLRTNDGLTVQLDRLWLEVASSVAYRKPMLQMSYFYGEARFNAEYGIFNKGWGAIEEAEFSFRITDPTGRSSGSQQFLVSVAPFDREGAFNLESALIQNGIDVQQLKNAHFPCASRAVLNQCFSQALSVLDLGSLASYVGVLDNSLVFAVEGNLTFSWDDAFGRRLTASQPLQTFINLATMDLGDLAELGSGWADVPEAPGHVNVVLPVGRENYRIDLPFRAGSNVQQIIYPLKIRAEMSSTHDLRIGAQFRDGSIRYSAPVTLYYFRPRD